MIFTKLECKRTKQTIKDAAHLVEYGAKQKDADNLVQYGAGNSKEHAKTNKGHSFYICSNEIECIPVKRGELATGGDWSDAISELQSSLKHNSNVTESFRHFVISLDEGEHVTDKQWKKAIKKTMKHLGYDSARYIAFKHSDTDSEHIHITASTQCLESNKVINDWQSVTNAQTIMRELEKKFGLKELISTKDMDRTKECVADKQAPDTVKFMIRRLVNKAIDTLDKKASLVDFELALLNVGITIHLKEDMAKEDVSQKMELAIEQLEKVRRYAIEKAEEVKKELESYDKSQINRMMFTYHKNKATQANMDYWLYHGKKIRDLLDKQVVHAIYEYEKGVYKASGQVTEVFRMLLTILFEMSKREGSYLQVTPLKKSNDEEKELAGICEKSEREFHLESSQRFNSKAFRELNKVKNNALNK